MVSHKVRLPDNQVRVDYRIHSTMRNRGNPVSMEIQVKTRQKMEPRKPDEVGVILEVTEAAQDSRTRENQHVHMAGRQDLVGSYCCN